MSDPAELDLAELARAIRARKMSSAEITAALLDRAQRWQPRLNAFVRIERDEALAAAKAADAALARGDAAGPLHGVPLAHKDMYYFAGKVAGCGSKIRADWIAPATSTVIERLQAAGTIRFGALHMSEFAYGPSGHNSHLGPACNPWDPKHITGGSSSGSGAAVAACLTPAALGSDTGGSVRGPANFCGVTGLKTSAGRVSRANVMPLSFTLDTVGPLARTAEDCGLITEIIAGPDARDPTTAAAPAWNTDATRRPAQGLTVGVPTRFYVDDLDAAVAATLDAAIATFERMGVRIRKVELPDQIQVSAAATTIIATEATTYHAAWLRERPQDYGPQVRARLENGLGFGAVEYLQALRWRGPALAAHLHALGDIDMLLAPVTRTPAPTIVDTDVGAGPGAEATIQNITRFMRPVNYLGLPALAFPAGQSPQGLPIGLQVIGRPFRDEALVALGIAFQKATDHHRRRPRLP